MAKGFIRGVFASALISIGALGGLSLIVGAPPPPTVSDSVGEGTGTASPALTPDQTRITTTELMAPDAEAQVKPTPQAPQTETSVTSGTQTTPASKPTVSDPFATLTTQQQQVTNPADAIADTMPTEPRPQIQPPVTALSQQAVSEVSETSSDAGGPAAPRVTLDVAALQSDLPDEAPDIETTEADNPIREAAIEAEIAAERAAAERAEAERAAAERAEAERAEAERAAAEQAAAAERAATAAAEAENARLAAIAQAEREAEELAIAQVEAERRAAEDKANREAEIARAAAIAAAEAAREGTQGNVETTLASPSQELPQAATTIPEAVAPATEDAPPAQDAPETAALPGRPAIQQGNTADPDPDVDNIGTVDDRAIGVTTNRLPTAGQTTPAIPGEASGEAADPIARIPSGSPLAEFGQAFSNPDDKPLMAIVLMDEGQDLSQGPVGLEALDSFPYPISFAVDAILPDATARMARYRENGFEVLALLNLPEGATASDAEVSVAAALNTLPEVVGLFEGPGTGVQSSRTAADQVAAILASTGHGFVTQNRGLNTVQKLAARNGVPSAVVFRDFDSKDQKPTVIRRFLDQAAFKARQEGGVIMLGRLRADTISALLVWGLADRASQVALAPVSAVLMTAN